MIGRFELLKEKNFSIKTSGSIFPVIIMYTKMEIAMKIINMPKHPMANSLLIWLMEYLMNSKNMESHLGIRCLLKG